MIFNYVNFYRRYGVRMVQQLAKPNMFEIGLLNLPINSIYHYISYDGSDNGPPAGDFLFRNLKKPTLVGHVLEQKELLGNPRQVHVATTSLIRDYHASNRQTRPLRRIESVDRDPQTLVVYNYSLLSKTYKYIHSIFTEYYKWHNTFATVIENISSVSELTDRQHYLVMTAPKILPSLQQLDIASKGMTQALLKVFDSKEALTLLELWKWLGSDSKESLFSKIPDNKLHLVNLVFKECNLFFVVNLGHLNGFVSQEDKTRVFEINSTQQLSGVQIRKRLLRMFMSVMEVRTLSVAVNQEVEVEQKTAEDLIDAGETAQIEDERDEQAEDTSAVHTHLEDEEAIIAPTLAGALDPEDEDVIETEEEIAARTAQEDEMIEQELSELNQISELKSIESQQQESTLQQVIFETKTPPLEDGVMSVCDKLASEGLMSAGEYKKYSQWANAYKTILSSDGKTTLSEFVKIDPKDLLITQSSSVPDSNLVFDKSMLKSSLLTFDEKYITDILAKDTVSMVLSVQKAGIALTDHTVEKVSSILGDYESHSIKLNPVIGQQSTLRFKLPIVSKEGTFKANGTEYRLRKQRGDVPIRKTAPDTVALTSYYGKSFITRGMKKSENYANWLQQKIIEKALSSSKAPITNLVTKDVFNSEKKAPKAYTSLAMYFSGFSYKSFNFCFDETLREKLFSKEEISLHQKDGNLILAKSSDGRFLVMDKNSDVYLSSKEGLSVIGTIADFLDLQEANAPVEFASVGIFGKDIPVGIVLAMQMGFQKLLRLLKVNPRKVNAGQRLNLTSREYALVFSDDTLIFSKDDVFASMVLSGFNSYHRTLRAFSVQSFDQRAVYNNILEANAIGVRYGREIDLMYKMFVDPITRDILIEMNEPTTFEGLLLRSCEMLLLDNHPDELDPAFMRIKGYERVAGAVFSELIQSIRAHNGRLGKSTAAIEMNPYAVWKRISEDPSKKQAAAVNPIQALKEIEAVTLAGTGGRNKRSMTKHTRAYHKNDMGTISESTVDSSDVAINVFTSADPQFTSLRGLSKRYTEGEIGVTSLLSTSALMAVGSDRDD